MKTCPICGETYSERIDFCFSDGAVLSLSPSAMDAPVPRMVGRAERSGHRLRAEHTEEIEAPVEAAVRSVPVPAPTGADEVPVPAHLLPESPSQTWDDALDEEAEAEATQPVLDSVGSPELEPETEPEEAETTVDDLVVPPLFDGSEGDLEERKTRVVPWWVYSAAAAVLVVVLIALIFGTGTRRTERQRAPATAAPPVTVEVSEPAGKPAAAEPRSAPSAPAEPRPEPSPSGGEARPGADDPVRSPAPPDPAAAPPAPATPPVAREPKRPAAPAATPRSKPARVPVEQAPAAPSSPWTQAPEPADAVATFSSDPEGALVRVDGRLRGKTPLDLKLPYGIHELTLELDGYQTLVERIDIASPSPKFPKRLEPAVRSGNVLVIAPGWDGATLLVDGKASGTLPAQLRLTEGAHRFELRQADRLGRDERVVRLSDGLTRLTLDPQ